MTRHPHRLLLVLVAGFVALGDAPATAQSERLAIDLVAATDAVHGSTPRRDVSVWLDAFVAVHLADGLDVLARPVVTRRAFDGSWQKLMYQLGVRYERRAAHSGGVGLRLDAGVLTSPIGLAMLENRPDMNPVVSQHSAYYMSLPRIDREIPRVGLIAAAYPLGAQATVSAKKWDLRVAAIDSSPVRGRPFFDAGEQPRLLNGVVGLGYTPRVGLRVGGAVAHGPYAAVSEVTTTRTGDRDATMLQLEAEWSFGHTRIVGEWIGTRLETARQDNVASGWWAEASQTLSPRFFVAGRVDYQRYRYQLPTQATETQDYDRVEATLGVRLSPDVTLRGGYMLRHGYVVSHWDDQVIGSIVWQKKVR